jgi:hypothetical protein
MSADSSVPISPASTADSVPADAAAAAAGPVVDSNPVADVTKTAASTPVAADCANLAGEYRVSIKKMDEKKEDATTKGGSRRRQRRQKQKSKKRANKRRTRSRSRSRSRK